MIRFHGIVVALLAALAFFITGAFMAIDWANHLYDLKFLFPAYAKPVVSLLCALIVVFGGAFVDPGDRRLLLFSFLCILVADAAMSVFVYAPDTPAAGNAFLIGAASSIVAHLVLIIRHGRGFHFLKRDGHFQPAEFKFAFWFFAPVALILVLLADSLMKVGQFWPSLVYGVMIAASLWIAWETVRRELFPRPNALLIALGSTSWFLTEIVGVFHNIKIGEASVIAMHFTWVFYMPAILMLALSGLDFNRGD